MAKYWQVRADLLPTVSGSSTWTINGFYQLRVDYEASIAAINAALQESIYGDSGVLE